MAKQPRNRAPRGATVSSMQMVEDLLQAQTIADALAADRAAAEEIETIVEEVQLETPAESPAITIVEEEAIMPIVKTKPSTISELIADGEAIAITTATVTEEVVEVAVIPTVAATPPTSGSAEERAEQMVETVMQEAEKLLASPIVVDTAAVAATVASAMAARTVRGDIHLTGLSRMGKVLSIKTSVPVGAGDAVCPQKLACFIIMKVTCHNGSQPSNMAEVVKLPHPLDRSVFTDHWLAQAGLSYVEGDLHLSVVPEWYETQPAKDFLGT